MVKCCDITASDLRTLITIERRTATPDGSGGFTEVWAEDPAGGVWANMKGITGIETFFADRVKPGNKYRAIIRFRGDGSGAPYYTINDRVQYKGRTLGILSVMDMEDRQQYLRLDLLENKAT